MFFLKKESIDGVPMLSFGGYLYINHIQILLFCLYAKAVCYSQSTTSFSVTTNPSDTK